MLVTPASTTDRDTARTMLPALRESFRKPQLVWADGGCTGHLVDWAAQELGLVLEVVKRSDDTSGFRVLPRRWVVERSFAWLIRSRRLARDYETEPASSKAVILWSMTMVMSRRLARRKTRVPHRFALVDLHRPPARASSKEGRPSTRSGDEVVVH
ncbi:transposase [Streptomyces sp. NPDC088246]|uniref:transposase n=1 Tax=Streptomyces sp. NPDC088246 TaxID=3365842 RepID=UPI0037FCE328